MHSPEWPYSAVNNDFTGIDVNGWRLFYSGSIGVTERWVLVISVVSLSFIANMPNKYPEPGVLFNIGYPSKIHFKLKSREISFAHNTCSKLFNPFEIVHRARQWYCCADWIIELLEWMLWPNEISQDLSLEWVSDRYPILRSTPVVFPMFMWPAWYSAS